MKIEESAFYRSRINEWPEGERPREKLMQLGAERLSVSELLAILLRTGSRTLTALDLAKTLLTRCGQLRGLAGSSYEELARLKGIGPVKAVSLVAAFEVGRRIASLPAEDRIKITGPEVVFKRFAPLLADRKTELFLVLALNSANIVVREIQVSEGTLNASLVHPREVFRSAILATAASIILLHNHPSGEVRPSREDSDITARLVEAGRLMDIPVLDHVIVGRDRYYSFKEAGHIA